MTKRILHRSALIVTLLLIASFSSAAQTVSLDSMDQVKLVNVQVEKVAFKGRKALQVRESATTDADESLVVLTKTDFQDGIIEVDLAGEPGPNADEGARGFVGIAFRVASAPMRFECFYLRPTNGRAEDQIRRNHSVQYVSFPGFPWQFLRKNFPEKYESYVDILPGEWTKVKIEVRGEKARLFVNGVEQPNLIVNDLKQGNTRGAIALWVGAGTVAHFANLKIKP